MKKLSATVGLALALAWSLAGAQVPISALPSGTTPTGVEQIPGVQTGQTVKFTVDQLQSFILTGNAATASALANTPTQCAGQQFAVGVTALGNANCVEPIPQTANEVAASVTPVNYLLQPGNVLRYENNLIPGTTDMTVGFNNALLANARAYVPAGSYLVVGQITMQSNNILYGDGSASVLNFPSTAQADNITGTGLTGPQVSDLKLVVTGVQTGNNYQGVIGFHNTNNCRVQRVEIVGVYGGGIELAGTQYCVVTQNYFHGFQGAYLDSDDIHVDATATANSLYNVIAYNDCFGGNWAGVNLQNISAVAEYLVANNLVQGNRVGQHVAYGIELYDHGPNGQDTHNQVSANYVENIQGSVLGGDAGAGIYVAGMGGVVITANTVVDCCVQSSTNTLLPAGIAINYSSQTGLSPFVISGNGIFDVGTGNANSSVTLSGIEVFGSLTGGTISSNTISFQAANTVGDMIGVWLLNSNNIAVGTNTINISTSLGAVSSEGIAVYGNAASPENISITGNTVLGTVSKGIDTQHVTSGTITNLNVSNNNITGGSATSVPLFLSTANIVNLSNNVAIADTTFAAQFVNAANLRATNNTFSTTGTTALTMAGACGGTQVSETNLYVGNITNFGTGGCNVSQYLSSLPGSGDYVVGDTIVNSAPTATSQDRWRVTTGGLVGSGAVFTALTLP